MTSYLFLMLYLLQHVGEGTSYFCTVTIDGLACEVYWNGMGECYRSQVFLVKSCLLQVRYHSFVMFICIAEECGLLADS